MSAVETYREHLRQMCDWESFLLAESRLPGPWANLDLAQAAADEGDATQFRAWLAIGADEAPANTPGEFLPLCGVLGFGRLLAEGDRATLADIRRAANDFQADPLWSPLIPNWNRVESALPNFTTELCRAVKLDNS